MKKIVAILICCVAVLGGFAGCGEKGSGINEKIDKNKTQLYIGVYDGGLGTDWIKEVRKNFEAQYASEHFETGKTGVQVMFDPKKLQFEPDTLIANLQNKSETSDIYYTATHALYKFRDGGVVADITEALNKKVYKADGSFGGTEKSILDKMDPYFVESYKTKTGGYDAFPFEDSTQGIVYDHDLFVEKGYLDNGPGPDGEPDTYDDGLPQTMDDFYDMLLNMKKDKITPFTWTGQNPFYFTCLTTAIVAQYEGIDGANQNLFYTGEHAGQPITYKNGYLLADQQGKLEALKFLREITSDPDYYSKSAFGSTQTHLAAQAEFVTSPKIGKRTAMIIEGEWWENEARANFTSMETTYGSAYAYGKRDFRFLPIPRMEGQAQDGTVLTSFSSGSVGFVNKNSTKQDLAELWLQFQHSSESLAIFTTKTGSVLGYDYDILPDQYASMTKFAQSVWNIRRDKNVTVYRTSNQSDYQKYANLKMGGVGSEIYSTVGGVDQKNALTAFHNNRTLTAQQYFDGAKTYYNVDAWNNSVTAFEALLG